MDFFNQSNEFLSDTSSISSTWWRTRCRSAYKRAQSFCDSNQTESNRSSVAIDIGGKCVEKLYFVHENLSENFVSMIPCIYQRRYKNLPFVTLNKNLGVRKGSRTGNSGNHLEFQVLTLIEYVP